VPEFFPVCHQFEHVNGVKLMVPKNLAEREGFEPSVQVLARTTV
jgi:hypothetical protein